MDVLLAIHDCVLGISPVTSYSGVRRYTHMWSLMVGSRSALCMSQQCLRAALVKQESICTPTPGKEGSKLSQGTMHLLVARESRVVVRATLCHHRFCATGLCVVFSHQLCILSLVAPTSSVRAYTLDASWRVSPSLPIRV